MKFLKAKNENTVCLRCGTIVLKNEEMIITFMDKPGYKRMFFFHVQCYIPWYTDMFNRKWTEWKYGSGSNKDYPKMGRPVKYQEATKEIKVNRLRALRTYHRKLGHEAKVQNLQKRLDRLTLI